MPVRESNPSSFSINSFSTGILISSVGILLGTLFMAFVVDQRLLYTGQPTTPEAYVQAEYYYLTLWTSPLIFKALFHIILLTPIFTLCVRVSRYTESALYFDGISLLLSILVLGLYTGSTIPNMRKLAASPSNQVLSLDILNLNEDQTDPSSPQTFLNKILILLSYPTTILIKSNDDPHPSKPTQPMMNDSIRFESLSVTAAGHSIGIFLLLGILVLQAGKVYAENEQMKLLNEPSEQDRSSHVSQDRKTQ